jgi:hypothetical protein
MRIVGLLLAAFTLAACYSSRTEPAPIVVQPAPTVVVPQGATVVCPNGAPAVVSGGAYRCY